MRFWKVSLAPTGFVSEVLQFFRIRSSPVFGIHNHHHHLTPLLPNSYCRRNEWPHGWVSITLRLTSAAYFDRRNLRTLELHSLSYGTSRSFWKLSKSTKNNKSLPENWENVTFQTEIGVVCHVQEFARENTSKLIWDAKIKHSYNCLIFGLDLKKVKKSDAKQKPLPITNHSAFILFRATIGWKLMFTVTLIEIPPAKSSFHCDLQKLSCDFIGKTYGESHKQKQETSQHHGNPKILSWASQNFSLPSLGRRAKQVKVHHGWSLLRYWHCADRCERCTGEVGTVLIH